MPQLRHGAGLGTGEEFEPDNVAHFKVLCDEDLRVLDVGANIGMTTLVLSQICPRGQIAAIEPLPRTFNYLRRDEAFSELSLDRLSLSSEFVRLVQRSFPIGVGIFRLGLE